MKFLTRKGFLIEEQGMTVDTDPDTALGPLRAAACTYRIALCRRQGFSLHAEVCCAAHERHKLESQAQGWCCWARRGRSAKLRAEIIPSSGRQVGDLPSVPGVPSTAIESNAPAAEGETPLPSPLARLSWVQLLKRVFEIDLEHCPHCGGPLKIIAAIEHPPVIANQPATPSHPVPLPDPTASPGRYPPRGQNAPGSGHLGPGSARNIPHLGPTNRVILYPEQVGQGDLEYRIPERGTDEFNDLAIQHTTAGHVVRVELNEEENSGGK